MQNVINKTLSVVVLIKYLLVICLLVPWAVLTDLLYHNTIISMWSKWFAPESTVIQSFPDREITQIRKSGLNFGSYSVSRLETESRSLLTKDHKSKSNPTLLPCCSGKFPSCFWFLLVSVFFLFLLFFRPQCNYYFVLWSRSLGFCIIL